MNMDPAACELAGAALIGAYCELTIVPLVLCRAPFNVAAYFIVEGYAIFDIAGIVVLIRIILKKK